MLLAQLASSRVRSLAIVVAIAAISLVNLHKMDTWWSTVPSNPPIAPRNLQPLISTLDKLKVDHIYATYWLAYRLDFETRERIVAAENRLTDIHIASPDGVAEPDPQTDPPSRYPAYTTQVAADTRHGFVFFNREPGDMRRAERAKVMAFLLAHGYIAHRVSIFTVYAPPQ